jgi:hypothetical protein
VTQLLLLFSSDARPQYAQDILNILGFPTGCTYTFRYRREYVSQVAQGAWSDLPNRKDLTALILFSLQQDAHYHDAVFVPIRRARVVATRKEGDIHLVKFALEALVSLNAPPNEDGALVWSTRVKEFRRRFGDGLPQTEQDCPYAASASLVSDSSLDDVLDTALTDQATCFMRTVEYLGRTAAFHNANFVRFESLYHAAEAVPINANDKGEFLLEGGKSYELRLMHFQPRQVATPTTYRVGADDDLVEVIGRAGFDIASEYDMPAIPFHTKDVTQKSSTILNVNPQQQGIQGSEIAIPITLGVSKSLKQAVGGTAAIAASGFIGLVPNTNVTTPLKFAVVLVAAAGLFALLFYGKLRITSG